MAAARSEPRPGTANLARFLDAGLDLVAEGGWPALTVAALCRAAGLEERAFRASFTGLDSFERALVRLVVDEVDATLSAATGNGEPGGVVAQLTADLQALLLEDRGRRRALGIEPALDSTLSPAQDARRLVVARIRSLLESRLLREEPDGAALAVGLAGACWELVASSVAGDLVARPEDVLPNLLPALPTTVDRPPATRNAASPAPDDRSPDAPTSTRAAEDSARRLRDAATELMAEQGWRSVTAGAIAERAGLSREMVRVRFGSRDALLQAVLRQLQDDILDEPPDSVRGLARLEFRVESFLDQYRRRRRLLLACNKVHFEAIGPTPELLPISLRERRRIEDDYLRCVREAQEDGDVRADLDLDAEARSMLDALNGLLMRWMLQPDEVDLDAIYREWLARELRWLTQIPVLLDVEAGRRT